LVKSTTVTTEGAIFAVAVAVALAPYGFYTSLAGQRVFGGRLIED